MTRSRLTIDATIAFPLAGIAELPTPLERLPVAAPVVAESRADAVWVKRDDLTSRVYGGNKVRKLDLLLGDALERGSKVVLTFGAYGSNHALATAIHATRLGLEPHVVLSPQDPGPFAPRTLLAHAALGTQIHLVDGWDGRREAVVVRRELEARDGIEPYVIPMGGTCALGAIGYVNAAFEILDAGLVPDVVYVASGTLGTAVGLALGFALRGAPTRVEAVRVTPAAIASADIVEQLTDDTVALLGSAGQGLSLTDLRLDLREEFFEPGYGIVTPQTTEAVRSAEDLGLHLETTYTGKAFSAMLADGRSGALAGECVLFVDTYNSAPYPDAGDLEALPDTLRAYIAECRRLFPDALGVS